MNIKKIFMQCIIVLLIVFVNTSSYASGINTFYGTWGVDFERTIEETKNSPKYSQEQADKMPNMIKRMMNMMKIRITESEMIYLRGEKEIAYHFRVVEETENSARIECSVNEQTFHIDFTLLEGAYMNFKSSGSDDMNYYIWKLADFDEEN